MPTQHVEWTKEVLGNGQVRVTLNRVNLHRDADNVEWDYTGWDKQTNKPVTTTGKIWLFFPKTCVFGKHQVNPEVGKPEKIHPGCDYDTYEYAAYFDQWHTYAVGNSSPIIEVKP